MIKFDATAKELKLIDLIIDRAASIYPDVGRIEMMMDLNACISNGTPLKLDELLAADNFNFTHDVFGISNHIDRDESSPTGGQLQHCFRPRFAKAQ